MGHFVDGEWKEGWYSNSEDGKFERPPTTFREEIEDLEPGRYHLYVSWACPWAHRTLIARSVLGLKDKISVSYVDWYLDDGGWRFHPEHEGSTRDHLFGFDRLRHVYTKADPNYTGRVTVPVLWDTRKQTIVNNESREILRMLSTRTRPRQSGSAPDLCPDSLRDKIDQVLDEIYEPINNGVYKAGFATSQQAYDRAVTTLFEQLERWEKHLSKTDHLVHNQFTEADICLFTTLVRFDPIYHTHFKCSKKMISQLPELQNFLRRIYNTPGVMETCRLDHMINHYYKSHKNINPHGIVAVTPASYKLRALESSAS